MKIGMLWFDNDPSADLAVKVERAARFYAEKYGKYPTLIYTPPDQASAPMVGEIEIKGSRTIPIHHLWVGMKE